jgi:alkanesulfonate monooxygenase SsuD/methylene tetrahydromethanopterin reductase-like flavin-dependent oxidoreductase (luciferase family)
MQRSVVLAFSGFRGITQLARQAEAAGLSRAWMTEYHDRDAVVRAAAVGCSTTNLGVGTGIAYSFTRHPLALAAAVLDTHEATGGRFALGLGTGTRGMRHRWFGINDERPVDRMRETVDVVRNAWRANGRFSYHGRYTHIEIDDLALGERTAQLPEIQIYGSGLNPAMVAAAATWCDGILLHPMAVGSAYWESVVAPVARAGGPRHPWLAQWVVTAVDDDHARAEHLAQRALAFYLATPSYKRHFAVTRWADVSKRMVDAFRQIGPRWNELAALVPSEMVGEYCLAGSPKMVQGQLQQLEPRLEARGVDELVLQIAVTGLADGERILAVQAAVRALGRTCLPCSGRDETVLKRNGDGA